MTNPPGHEPTRGTLTLIVPNTEPAWTADDVASIGRQERHVKVTASSDPASMWLHTVRVDSAELVLDGRHVRVQTTVLRQRDGAPLWDLPMRAGLVFRRLGDRSIEILHAWPGGGQEPRIETQESESGPEGS